MIRLVVPFGLAAVIVLAGTPAMAAGDEIGLSLDGTSWSSDLTDPLFDPAIRWAPGDTRVESFLVRNQSSTASTLDVEITNTMVEGLLATGDLHLDAKVGNQPWKAFSGGSVPVSSDLRLAVGQHERISVRATFDEAADNQTQQLPFDLDFEVRLTQASGIAVPGDNPEPGTQPLPATGGPSWWLAAVGAAALGWGLTLVTRRRKEQPDA
ncbi:LPXTG cell wall anchor domain-containing protein [Nocardioides sp.]|uniref:LPXTG cell wall anchor domain-containing protein n=1 Tax=Nocardioides sp. TaxID=35761 RepID=UPI003D0A9FE9